MVTKQKQIIIILALAFFLGILRSFFIKDPDFSIIKKEREFEEINSFSIPNEMTSPMVVNLEFSKYHYDSGTATFIDAREPEEYELGHIQGAINIPFDYYEEYEDLINKLDEEKIYITYCSGGECSLSMDLADYLYHEKLFDFILIFEGGWPEWRDTGYP